MPCMCFEPSVGVFHVYVSGFQARGKAAFAIKWSDERAPQQGVMIKYPYEVFAVVDGVKHALEQAKEDKTPFLKIHVATLGLDELLTERQYPADPRLKQLLDAIYSYPAGKVEYAGFCSHFCLGYAQPIQIAQCLIGAHSKSDEPINDNLYKNGIIGVAVHGVFAMTASGEKKGAYGYFFEKNLIDSGFHEMNEGGWLDKAENESDAQLGALNEVFVRLLMEQYRKVRIITGSSLIRDLISLHSNHHLECSESDSGASEETIRFCFLLGFFHKVVVEYNPTDKKSKKKIAEAQKLALRKFDVEKDAMYGTNEKPTFYVDGACSNNGKNGAAAAGGVFCGPDHPWNSICFVVGEQTSNNGEFAAVAKALRIAIRKKILELTIATDSQFVIDSIMKLPKYMSNNWRTNKGFVKNRYYLEIIAKLLDEFKHVEFVKVPAHSGHEGNDGADRMAKIGAEVAAQQVEDR